MLCVGRSGAADRVTELPALIAGLYRCDSFQISPDGAYVVRVISRNTSSALVPVTV